ncbi:MAG: GIY-YIG nuclease family protein [Verrucomicrobia bacterium]|nr:GIY-YIG nuclease family protein [Verrucomicrobiota bacterium]
MTFDNYRVYVLRNLAGKLYIGVTADVARRLGQHNSGQSKWTAKTQAMGDRVEPGADDAERCQETGKQTKTTTRRPGILRINRTPFLVRLMIPPDGRDRRFKSYPRNRVIGFQ